MRADAFYTVKLLEDAGWTGCRHFDAHAYRTETIDGVWDFARGCMRSYLIMREKARRFHADPEIQEALQVTGASRLAEPTMPAGMSAGAIAALVAEPHTQETAVELGGRPYGLERLDQLVTELLLGVR